MGQQEAEARSHLVQVQKNDQVQNLCVSPLCHGRTARDQPLGESWLRFRSWPLARHPSSCSYGIPFFFFFFFFFGLLNCHGAARSSTAMFIYLLSASDKSDGTHTQLTCGGGGVSTRRAKGKKSAKTARIRKGESPNYKAIRPTNADS